MAKMKWWALRLAGQRGGLGAHQNGFGRHAFGAGGFAMGAGAATRAAFAARALLIRSGGLGVAVRHCRSQGERRYCHRED